MALHKEAKEEPLPKFISDVYDAFLQVIQDCEGIWQVTPPTTRVIIALVMAVWVSIWAREPSDRE